MKPSHNDVKIALARKYPSHRGHITANRLPLISGEPQGIDEHRFVCPCGEVLKISGKGLAAVTTNDGPFGEVYTPPKGQLIIVEHRFPDELTELLKLLGDAAVIARRSR